METTNQTKYPFGILRNYQDATIIRAATEEERDESRDADDTGAIMVEIDGRKIVCYVEER